MKKFLMALLVLFFVSASLYSKFKPFYLYYNFNYGARSLSMAHAFTAVANDLTAVFINPSGIAAFQTPRVYMNYHSDKVQYDYEIQSQQLGVLTQTYNYEFDSQLKHINFLSVSVPGHFWDLNWNFALTYYRYIPYGFEGKASTILTTMSEDGSSQEEESVYNFNGSSGIDALALTAAFNLDQYFSAGITFQGFLNSGAINYEFNSAEESFTRNYNEKIKGTHVILGFMFLPHKDVRLGFAYHTRLTDTFNSEYNFQQQGSETPDGNSTEAELHIPSQFSIGISIKPYKFMLLSYDYSQITWSKGTITNYYGNTAELPFPIRDDFAFEQLDIINGRLGVEFNIPVKTVTFFLRGGISRERQLFVGFDAEAVKVKSLSLGFGIDLSSLLILDFGYMRQSTEWSEAGYFDPLSRVNTIYKNDILSFSATYIFQNLRNRR
jgi:long-subunit fatty acid transport protein